MSKKKHIIDAENEQQKQSGNDSSESSTSRDSKSGNTLNDCE